MILYQFKTPSLANKSLPGRDHLRLVLEKVAASTPSNDLVTALYLAEGSRQNRGTAYVRDWMNRDQFVTGRGKWGFTRIYGTPDGVPGKYKLIRLRLDPVKPGFPRRERDTYGWEFTFRRFEDHLALLFAHELHHFRRFHLGLHPSEGEQKANQWALGHVTALGFDVQAIRRKQRRNKTISPGRYYREHPDRDPYRQFRDLCEGQPVLITRDPSGRYEGQIATVIRAIRANSRRMVIRTADGRNWRWPMDWLIIGNPGKKIIP